MLTDTPVVRLDGLTKSYGDVHAVQGVDLTVEPGEVVAVLGPNGAGKTNTIEMMLGLRVPTSGTVEVFGESPDARQVRGRVGAMLQDTDAPDALTVQEIVDLVRHYYPHPLTVRESLGRADLLGERRKRAAQLSGGQRQRLSFAIALCGDPDLLYLDEPTSALDIDGRERFWDQVQDLAATGRTVLFSTHNLAEAQRAASRVVVMGDGRVIADGGPAQVSAVVGGSLVRLCTDAPRSLLEGAVGDPERVRGDAGSYEIRTAEPETLLRSVFGAGHDVRDLTVAEADLESAFRHLTTDLHRSVA